MGRWFGRSAVARFGREVRGNVAMMLALMGAGLIGVVGLTVDYTHAQTLQAQLQNAADVAALVAERRANLPIDERTAAARAFFNAEMGSMAAQANFTVTQLADGGSRVEASMPMPLSMAKIINSSDWRVSVVSEAQADASPP